jgi:FlaA1/EpsC-like NDP-sugar epimerase
VTDVFTREEQEFLLGRPLRPLLATRDRRRFAGASVLVTGAGGTIGSELARQIAACRPARLTLVDHSEHALFRIEQELRDSRRRVAIEPVLEDVTRRGAMLRVVAAARPAVVFHAAAYKHVTMAERAICAAARVNVLGTAVALEAAASVGARFTLVSTDKAAAPQSVMGATKRFAELVAIAACRGTRVHVVRFGNVLASSGSFVTLMAERIAAGRSIVLTDPDATRYFMTVAEAVSLVMKADRLATGGETFWFDMGDAIRIGDLADRLASIGEQRGHARVPRDVIGLRPGEKRAEELTTQGLAMARTSDPLIWVARQAPRSAAIVRNGLRALARAVSTGSAHATLNALTALVPEFQPSAHATTLARSEQLYSRSERRLRAKTA